MNSIVAAAACLVLALSASAAKAPKSKAKVKLSRTAGKVLEAGPERLTLLDKAGDTVELKITRRTKVALDGKASTFTAASPGTLVLNALYNPASKELTSLVLISAPKNTAMKAAADDQAKAGKITGEVSNTDIFKNTLSLRVAGKFMRDFTVPEGTKIVREVKGKADMPQEFEAIQIGDTIEISSLNGRVLSEIRVRAR